MDDFFKDAVDLRNVRDAVNLDDSSLAVNLSNVKT